MWNACGIFLLRVVWGGRGWWWLRWWQYVYKVWKSFLFLCSLWYHSQAFDPWWVGYQGSYYTSLDQKSGKQHLGLVFPLGISLKGSERPLKTHVQSCWSHDFEIDWENQVLVGDRILTWADFFVCVGGLVYFGQGILEMMESNCERETSPKNP